MNELVVKYKNSENEINKIRLKATTERTKIDDEIEGINEYYAASVNVLNEDRMKKVTDLENQKKFISTKALNEIEEYERDIDEVKEIVNILIGKYSITVHRITEKELKKACKYNRKVYFFDEMYDSDALSLRAVIVGRKGRMAAMRKKLKYSLLIIGHGESMKKDGRLVFSPFGAEDFFYVSNNIENNIQPFNINFIVKSGHDIKELIDYYQKFIKERDGEEDWHMEYLNDGILAIENQHKKNLEVQEKYSFDDFKPYLKSICYNCEKDGRLNDVKGNERCIHCNSLLMKNNGVK